LRLCKKASATHAIFGLEEAINLKIYPGLRTFFSEQLSKLWKIEASILTAFRSLCINIPDKNINFRHFRYQPSERLSLQNLNYYKYFVVVV